MTLLKYIASINTLPQGSSFVKITQLTLSSRGIKILSTSIYVQTTNEVLETGFNEKNQQPKVGLLCSAEALPKFQILPSQKHRIIISQS